MMFRPVLRLLLAMFSVFLVACGSGGGGEVTLPPVTIEASITSQPAAANVRAGDTVAFSVTAAGTSPQYQWRKNGTAIAGATGATLSFTAAEADDNSVYTVVVSNSANSVTSSSAALRVSPAVVITSAPKELGVIAGDTANFAVAATGSNLQYQWRKNGTDIAGANSATYSFVSSLGDDGALYSVRVSNAGGSATSNNAGLRVTAQFVAVSIAAQPANTAVRAGQEAIFTVLLGGTGPFSWDWLKNGVSTGTGVTNTFVNSPTLTFVPALLSDNGTVISLRVTDSLGNTVVTQVATLTVMP